MALKRCFFAFVSLWVCSGDNGTALTLQRRADVVKSVHGVNSGKTHKVVDKFTNPMLNKDRGIKEPLGGVTGIRPSGNPVKSSVDGENFSKGKPGLPRVITEPVRCSFLFLSLYTPYSHVVFGCDYVVVQAVICLRI